MLFGIAVACLWVGRFLARVAEGESYALRELLAACGITMLVAGLVGLVVAVSLHPAQSTPSIETLTFALGAMTGLGGGFLFVSPSRSNSSMYSRQYGSDFPQVRIDSEHFDSEIGIQ